MKNIFELTYKINWVLFLVSLIMIYRVVYFDESGWGSWVIGFLFLIPVHYLNVQSLFYFF